MDVVVAAEPHYLPWSMLQVYNTIRHGDLFQAFYDQSRIGSSVFTVEHWTESAFDNELAISTSSQVRFQHAFPGLERPEGEWSCVEDNINLTLSTTDLELHIEICTYLVVVGRRIVRFRLAHKEWSCMPAAEHDPSLAQLGPGCMATGIGTGNLNALEGPDNTWYAAMVEYDAQRVDAFLGLLIAMMADAEAKETLISPEAAGILLTAAVRLPNGMRNLSLAQPEPDPVPMDIPGPERPPTPPTPPTPHFPEAQLSHSRSASSGSVNSGAETVRAWPLCNGNSTHSTDSCSSSEQET